MQQVLDIAMSCGASVTSGDLNQILTDIINNEKCLYTLSDPAILAAFGVPFPEHTGVALGTLAGAEEYYKHKNGGKQGQGEKH